MEQQGVVISEGSQCEKEARRWKKQNRQGRETGGCGFPPKVSTLHDVPSRLLSQGDSWLKSDLLFHPVSRYVLESTSHTFVPGHSSLHLKRNSSQASHKDTANAYDS